MMREEFIFVDRFRLGHETDAEPERQTDARQAKRAGDRRERFCERQEQFAKIRHGERKIGTKKGCEREKTGLRKFGPQIHHARDGRA